MKVMSSFCKNEDCPPSERLLAFQAKEIDPVEEEAIAAHLIICDFCAAEVDLYMTFPPIAEKVEPTKIPLPLFELATALLGNSRGATRSKLSRDIDQLYDDGF
jgi:hypothetical protein